MTENPALSFLLSRLESVTDRLERLTASSSGAKASVGSRRITGSESASPAVEGFNAIINGPLKAYADYSIEIGDLVKDQSLATQRLFHHQRQFILIATQAKKPDMESSAFVELLAPIQQEIATICSYRDENRGSPLFNHLSTVSEGVAALGWVTVEPTPAPYIGEMKDSAYFYASRVLKDHRDSDEKHAKWANAFIKVLTDLQAYVKDFHTTGLAWNPNGSDVQEVAANLASTASPSSSTRRARPPVPPRHDRPAASDASPAGSPSPAALFSAINKGDAVTSGLRKVSKPDTATGPAKSAAALTTATAAAATTITATARAPRTALEGNRWTIEHHGEGSNVVVEQTERQHAIYIYNCSNCTVTIKGKVNAITIDKCQKMGVLLDSVVSNVEVIGGRSLQVQIIGHVPNLTADSTDSLQVYVSRESLSLELFTAKSTAVNLLLPMVEEGDYTEHAIPEQFISRIVDGKVVTEVVEHNG